MKLRRTYSRSFKKIVEGLCGLWPETTVALFEENGALIHQVGPWLPELDELKATAPHGPDEREAMGWSSLEVAPGLCGLLVVRGPSPEQQSALRDLIAWSCQQAYEKRGVAAEALERYREVNLLYRLGETLGRARNTTEITRLLLVEAGHILTASVGMAVRFHSDGQWERLAALGDAQDIEGLQQASAAYQRQLASFEQPVCPPLCEQLNPPRAWVWLPLQIDQQPWGGILLERPSAPFTSIEQKNLMCLVWQAALAIENAEHHHSLEQKVQERTQKLQAEIQERRRAEERIRKQQEELRRLTILDELTGLYNRRYLFEAGGAEFAKALRYERDTSVLIMDIDHFKSINDNYGHDVGDIVLREVASLCKDQLRKSDLLCRYGGEEFVVVLPETGLSQAHLVAERLREAIAQKQIQIEGETLHITMSLGLTAIDPGDQKLEDPIKRADKALYQAKERGRNQTVLAHRR